jgi:hypothetical protein
LIHFARDFLKSQDITPTVLCTSCTLPLPRATREEIVRPQQLWSFCSGSGDGRVFFFFLKTWRQKRRRKRENLRAPMDSPGLPRSVQHLVDNVDRLVTQNRRLQRKYSDSPPARPAVGEPIRGRRRDAAPEARPPRKIPSPGDATSGAAARVGRPSVANGVSDASLLFQVQELARRQRQLMDLRVEAKASKLESVRAELAAARREVEQLRRAAAEGAAGAGPAVRQSLSRFPILRLSLHTIGRRRSGARAARGGLLRRGPRSTRTPALTNSVQVPGFPRSTPARARP